MAFGLLFGGLDLERNPPDLFFFHGASFPNSSLDTANQLAWRIAKITGASASHRKDVFGSYFPALFLESHSKILLQVKIVSKVYIVFYFGISQSQYKVVKKYSY